jgi:hypothetical protein
MRFRRLRPYRRSPAVFGLVDLPAGVMAVTVGEPPGGESAGRVSHDGRLDGPTGDATMTQHVSSFLSARTYDAAKLAMAAKAMSSGTLPPSSRTTPEARSASKSGRAHGSSQTSRAADVPGSRTSPA